MKEMRMYRRIRSAILVAASLHIGVSVCAIAQEAQAPLADALTGNTLSAVLFLPHAAAGGGSLDRVVFQAYLRADGSALMRRWQPAQNAYSALAERRWSVSGNLLCLDFPPNERVPRTCVEIHVWGPRIAGNSTGPGQFALLDGDIEPGNAIAAAH
jgi:hypothetical protein